MAAELRTNLLNSSPAVRYDGAPRLGNQVVVPMDPMHLRMQEIRVVVEGATGVSPPCSEAVINKGVACIMSDRFTKAFFGAWFLGAVATLIYVCVKGSLTA